MTDSITESKRRSMFELGSTADADSQPTNAAILQYAQKVAVSVTRALGGKPALRK